MNQIAEIHSVLMCCILPELWIVIFGSMGSGSVKLVLEIKSPDKDGTLQSLVEKYIFFVILKKNNIPKVFGRKNNNIDLKTKLQIKHSFHVVFNTDGRADLPKYKRKIIQYLKIYFTTLFIFHVKGFDIFIYIDIYIFISTHLFRLAEIITTNPTKIKLQESSLEK
jgi:hypothetical protein